MQCVGCRQCHRTTRYIAADLSTCLNSENVALAVFRENDAPRYIRAFIAHIVVYGVQLATIVFLRLHLMHQNVIKRRAQAVAPSKTSGEDSVGKIFIFPVSLTEGIVQGENLTHQHAFDDLTDHENPDCKSN